MIDDRALRFYVPTTCWKVAGDAHLTSRFVTCALRLKRCCCCCCYLLGGIIGLVRLQLGLQVPSMGILTDNSSYMLRAALANACNCKRVCIHIYIYIRMYVCMYVCMCVYIYIYIVAKAASHAAPSTLKPKPHTRNPER